MVRSIYDASILDIRFITLRTFVRCILCLWRVAWNNIVIVVALRCMIQVRIAGGVLMLDSRPPSCLVIGSGAIRGIDGLEVAAVACGL